MKIKLRLAGLFISFCLMLGLPSLAFAAEETSLNVAETMNFDGLWYITAIIAVFLAVSIVISVFIYRHYQKQKSLLCLNFRCLENPMAQADNEDGFDFRRVETPNELTASGSDQATIPNATADRATVDEFTLDMIQQAIERLQSEQYLFKPEPFTAVGAHFKANMLAEPNQPIIQLVPPMRHSKAAVMQAQSQEAVDAQIEELLRKIS